MKLAHWLTISASFALIACSGSGGGKAIYHPDVGPFDENGDYIVALADAPVRKNVFSRSRSKAAPKPKKIKAPAPPKAQRLARVSPPAPVPRPVAVVRPEPSPTVLIAQSPRPQLSQAPLPVAQAQPRPVIAPSSPPQPKPVVVTPQKKAPARHLVRKTDTLFGLSRRYGVSVSSIQRANSLRGTTIVTGKTLLIPR